MEWALVSTQTVVQQGMCACRDGSKYRSGRFFKSILALAKATGHCRERTYIPQSRKQDREEEEMRAKQDALGPDKTGKCC